MLLPALFQLIVAAAAVSGAVLPQDVARAGEDRSIQARSPAGFVTRSGNGFVMDGHPFFFMGTNSYWIDQIAVEDIKSLFTQMNAAGLKVLRMFGWGDNVGGAQTSSFQHWSGTTNTPNEAAFAAHIDPIIAAAEKSGVKLVIPMIGNWGPSISLYIQQFEGSSGKHDAFYSNPKIIAAYKKYVAFFVHRYKNSPAIFAWELMNEPRCTGDDKRGASAACNNAMITSWINTMSTYIKSLDSQHMVTVGDEGWLTPAQKMGTSYPYSGSIGIDWVANLKLPHIDYGTIHLYPVAWGQADSWGHTWITQHATLAKEIGKPVVLEEFGTTATGTRYNTVNDWLNSAYTSGYSGSQYWEFVSKFPSGYASPDDGNGINVSEASFKLVKAMAVKMNAKS